MIGHSVARSARAEAGRPARAIGNASAPPDRGVAQSGSTRAHSAVSMNEQIYIRLSDIDSSFIYSVRRGAEVIEAAVVDATNPCAEQPFGGYYGGSIAMD